MYFSLVAATAVATSSLLIAQAGDESTGSPLLAWLPFILVGAALYFLAIRPQKKRAEALRGFQKSLTVGDEVRTAGGIIGVISSMSDDEVMVDVGGVMLRFARGAIAAHAGGDPE